ncbi:hypothetical protein P7K49_010662 [Saguinus oedipus]|uniref:C-type lectin domain-containing protein n=1 Tax=Saguinus oedipus TaxID=9490 RepID=A0ABQ9VP57_SAGOE|nr:hypothetical protein P7K49_010662 [Saguinus oedipus]
MERPQALGTALVTAARDRGHGWFSYHNFDRSRHDDDDIRGCAVLDLASLQWVAMQCDTQLDWICKIPRGTDVREPDDSSEGEAPSPQPTLLLPIAARTSGGASTLG